jgi:hypothetical protein
MNSIPFCPEEKKKWKFVAPSSGADSALFLVILAVILAKADSALVVVIMALRGVCAGGDVHSYVN